PDGSGFTLPMPESDPGRFEASFGASLSGLYTMRVRATGTTIYGSAFQREQMLSASVYPGGDRVADGGEPAGVRFWCELADCLESSGMLGGRVREILKDLGVDIDRFIRCLREHCRQFAPLDEGLSQAGGGTLSSLNQDRIRHIVEMIARELGSA